MNDPPSDKDYTNTNNPSNNNNHANSLSRRRAKPKKPTSHTTNEETQSYIPWLGRPLFVNSSYIADSRTLKQIFTLLNEGMSNLKV